MDELDRLFSLLVAALARETRVAVPFPAADVYERLVPYRSNRSRLNVATHQDYEMAVLRLLAGERNYVQLEPETVREAMQREIVIINPDPAYFRSFPDAQVMVNGRAAERVLLADRAYAPATPDEDEDLVRGRRSVRAIGQQDPLGGSAVHHHLRVGKAAEVGGIRVDNNDLALHRLTDGLRLELHVVALSCQEPQHCHFVILVR